MKTSDKIILSVTVTALTLFALVDFLHFAKYRKGEIMHYKDILATGYNRQHFEGVHWLVLDGPIRTTVYPSDDMDLYTQKANSKEFLYMRNGDTLTVRTVHQGARDAHLDWYTYTVYPRLEVFTPALKGVHVKRGFVTLSNDKGQSHLSGDFRLDSAQLWIGAYDPNYDMAWRIFGRTRGSFNGSLWTWDQTW